MTKDYDYYIIHVDEVKDGTPVGYILNPCIRETIEFYDMGDMVLKINKAMQRLKEEVEQSGMEDLPCFHPFRDLTFTKSPKYFFLIRMISSNNITWHGMVEGSCGHRKGFKSALDLMCKIDCVIRNGKKDRLHRTRRPEDNKCIFSVL